MPRQAGLLYGNDVYMYGRRPLAAQKLFKLSLHRKDGSILFHMYSAPDRKHSIYVKRNALYLEPNCRCGESKYTRMFTTCGVFVKIFAPNGASCKQYTEYSTATLHYIAHLRTAMPIYCGLRWAVQCYFQFMISIPKCHILQLYSCILA